MFKKTLLALALTGVASVANAADMVVTAENISIEGSATLASVAATNVVTTLKAEYTVGDTITFTISGAEFDTAASASAGLVFVLDDAADSATAGLLSVTATTATFRITTLVDATPGGAVTIDGEATLSGLKFKTASLASEGNVTLSYAAATSTGIAIDTGTKAKILAKKVTQFSSSVTKKLDAVVDVENERKQFVAPVGTTPTDTITTDSIVINTLVDNADAPVSAATKATATKAVSVIKGNFAWMESDGTAGISKVELDAAFAVTGAGAGVTGINSEGTEITITSTTVDEVVGTFTVLGKANSKAPILSAGDFTVDTAITYTTQAPAKTIVKALKTAEKAGSWTLNGFNQDISFMPFTDDYYQSITVANTGELDSNITVDMTANGVTKTHVLAAKAAAKATTNISEEVRQLAVADSIANVGGGAAHIKVIVNSPAKDISVSGVYYHKASQDRVKTK